MNQHSIQKAYLKTFADQSGRVWVYAKAGGRPVPKSPVQCAAEEDFQSPALEFYQNQVIETPGIKALRVNGSLSPEEFEQMSMWMALHIIRTQKARQQFFQSDADYEQRFHDELRKEQLFSAYYRYAYTHEVAEPNFVVTSDDPVIEFTCADFLMRRCALSPQKLIFFSPLEGKFEHELAMHDFFNAMMWGSPGVCQYSHRADLRIDTLREFARAYDLRAVLEDVHFETSSLSFEAYRRRRYDELNAWVAVRKAVYLDMKYFGFAILSLLRSQRRRKHSGLHSGMASARADCAHRGTGQPPNCRERGHQQCSGGALHVMAGASSCWYVPPDTPLARPELVHSGGSRAVDSKQAPVPRFR